MNAKHFITRSVGAMALVVALSIGAFASDAGATQYWGSGAVGYVGVPTATCTYYDVGGRLDVKVPAPTIYAPNRYAGSGNDAAWTRYQVGLLDSSGRFILQSNFSGWAASYDNFAARFTGVTSFIGIPNNSRVVFLVQWTNGDGSISQALHRADRYLLYSKGARFNRVDSCSKWTP